MLAIIGGGLLSAALAHAPSRPVMWLVAYLVLVVGVAQAVFGAGQARLAPVAPPWRLVAPQWLLFNTGNALVMAGTLDGHPGWVTAGAVLFVVALALFMTGVLRAGNGVAVTAYRTLLVLLGMSAAVGVVLALLRGHAA